MTGDDRSRAAKQDVPSTASGKALLLDWEEWRQTVGKSSGRDDPFAMRERLVATEKQAAAAERKRIDDAVTLDGFRHHCKGETYISWKGLLAILAEPYRLDAVAGDERK